MRVDGAPPAAALFEDAVEEPRLLGRVLGRVARLRLHITVHLRSGGGARVPVRCAPSEAATLPVQRDPSLLGRRQRRGSCTGEAPAPPLVPPTRAVQPSGQRTRPSKPR